MILIVDNRITRQEDFISNNPNLKKWFNKQELIHSYEEKELTKFQEKVLNKNIDFKIYGLVAIHYTFVEKFEYQIIEQCKDSDTCLVFFSGRFNYHYSKRVGNITILYMNVEDFYSNSFVNFIENYDLTQKMELSRLQFGDNWILSSCLQIRYNLHDWLCSSEEDSKELYYKVLIPESALESLFIVNRFFGEEMKVCIEKELVRDKGKLINQLAVLDEIIESLI